jgi:hypothetical protein
LSFIDFSTISNFINKVKHEIQEQCLLNLRQVEAFLENYSCLNTTVDIINKNGLLDQEDIFKTSSSTTLLSQISYIDEDD